ncbi:hypothetical protein RhiirA4_462025 [Rhizophagus irregularis]|uniref:Uncharacterized protein n=1 Tax=Rhizophagus irregularis TaxID=588596 RepID=A0A2I1GK34_9GLOM|nr:hypothetical protein RhiirA4_462025 [Rhizophagus irregularis]
MGLWDLPYNNFYLTFINFIKGFIPLALSKYLKSLSLNDKLVHIIIVGDLHNFIYNKVINNIWKSHCELQVILEKGLFIIKRKKLDCHSKNLKNNSSFIFINNTNFLV